MKLYLRQGLYPIEMYHRIKYDNLGNQYIKVNFFSWIINRLTNKGMFAPIIIKPKEKKETIKEVFE